MRYVCLVMSRGYIENHFEDILGKASVIEQRLDDSALKKEDLIAENESNLSNCLFYRLPYIFIDGTYEVEPI